MSQDDSAGSERRGEKVSLYLTHDVTHELRRLIDGRRVSFSAMADEALRRGLGLPSMIFRQGPME